MIPQNVNNLINIPRTRYLVVEEYGAINVFFEDNWIVEISTSNFFNLIRSTTFSKGFAHSNLLLFIYNEDNEIVLVNKNSKEHKKAMKEHLQIKDIPVLSLISFTYSNRHAEGHYLGEGLTHSNKESFFFELDDKIISSSDISSILLITTDSNFEPDFSKNIEHFEYSYGNTYPYDTSVIHLRKKLAKDCFIDSSSFFHDQLADTVFSDLIEVSLFSLNVGDVFKLDEYIPQNRMGVDGLNPGIYCFLGVVSVSKSESHYMFYSIYSNQIILSYSSFKLKKIDIHFEIDSSEFILNRNSQIKVLENINHINFTKEYILNHLR